jgi:methylphosphotriester-DNA--protein-cysteine methyltransferase
MPKAPIDGYEELFLTSAEKRRVADLADKSNLSAKQKRELAKRILSRAPQEAADVDRVGRMRDDPGNTPLGPQEET